MTSLEEELVPYHASPLPIKGDALIFAPHADDEILGCGGAIQAHLNHGFTVQVIVVTDGAGQGVDSKVRQDESIAASILLGYAPPLFWGLPDRELTYSEPLISRIGDFIKSEGAKVIYAPSPWEIHPDHFVVSLACLEAVRRLGNGYHVVLYEVGAPLQPNCLVDLEPYLEAKRSAVACFSSQLAIQRYDLQIEGLNRFRAHTLGSGGGAAEAFRTVSAEALQDGRLVSRMASLTEVGCAQVLRKRENVADAPLVSVICRVMGHPKFEEARASVAVQNYPFIEFIVVDAAGSGRPLSSWCGRFPQKVVTEGTKLPRSVAANRGLEAANGKYCLFLDEDDWIAPNHVQRLVNALEGSPKYRVAYTGVEIVTPDGKSTGAVLDQPFDPFRLLSTNLMPIHGVLFERALWERGARFDETLDIYEDWDFWLQLSGVGNFLHLEGVSGYYRQGGGSGVGADLDFTFDSEQRRLAGTLAITRRFRRRLSDAQLHELLLRGRRTLDTLAEINRGLKYENHALRETPLKFLRRKLKGFGWGKKG